MKINLKFLKERQGQLLLEYKEKLEDYNKTSIARHLFYPQVNRLEGALDEIKYLILISLAERD